MLCVVQWHNGHTSNQNVGNQARQVVQLPNRHAPDAGSHDVHTDAQLLYNAVGP